MRDILGYSLQFVVLCNQYFLSSALVIRYDIDLWHGSPILCMLFVIW